jgi:predicted TIM-barrel fold metal-dependent hydrolase
MFSTDYPHHHYDRPEDALPPIDVPEASLRKLLSENARSFYRL